MLKLEQIPDEVAWKLHNKLWGSTQFSVEEGRAAIAAALTAWPGMHDHDRLVVRDNGEGYDREVIGLILPLNTENSNDKA